jgi:2-desacetyl-2-hydroxyethyl bacteriochlorophyllide A dehydrogenase
MKALTFTGLESITYESIPDPELAEPTDVIVKVKYCAICGSDLHVYHGRETGIDHHTAMGHEFTGEVVETGSDVRHLQVGDKVISPFTTNCGQCYYCTIGLTSRCQHNQLFGWVQNGKGLQGGQAEFVRVPMAESTLLKLPDDITYTEALLLGDVLSTGYFCAQQAEIKPSRTYALIGCGPVGLMAICSAFNQGADTVYAIDTVAERLHKAKEFGAAVIDASRNDSVAVLLQCTGGRGADAVMDAVGSGSAGRLAYQLVRPGGIISAVGVCTDLQLPFSPVEAYDKNITYKVGRCPARFYMEKLIPLVRTHRYDLTSVFTHHLSLREGARGYDIFANKKEGCLKVLLEP